MRRRFSRRRRTGGADGRSPIDAASAIAKILEHKIVDAEELIALDRDDVSDAYAALARGTRPNGTPLVVSYSPLGGDALLGALGVALSTEGEDGAPFAGEALAIAPTWTAAGLQRLGRIGELPFSLRAISAPMLADGASDLEPEAWAPPIPLEKERVGAALASAQDRMLFARAAGALEGLASKYGGSVRGTATSLELVVLARRMAELRADGAVILETLAPQRSTNQLSSEDLVGVFDRLEGQLRKRINDRKVREGEEGLRSRCVPLIAEALRLRAVTPWPVAGSDREVVDLIGIDEAGHPVAAAVREDLDLDGVGELLDLGLGLQPVLALLLANAEPPLRLSAPRLAIAAQRFTPAAARALAALSLGHVLYEIRGGSRGLELAEISSGEAIERAVQPRPRRGGRGRSEGRGDGTNEAESGERPARARGARPEVADVAEVAAEPSAENGGGQQAGAESEDRESSGPRRSRRRGRRRRGGREDGGAREGSEDAASAKSEQGDRGAGADEPRSSKPLEVSLFDLDDEPRSNESAESDDRPRRSRSRRRGRRGGASTEDGEARSPGRGSRASAERGAESDSADPEPTAGADDDDDIDLEDAITILSDDAPDFEIDVAAPAYDEEEDLGEDTSDETTRTVEREKRRRARRSAAAPAAEAPRQPRRRAAIVACANRDALLSAILLARDLRLVEGVWVYPQSELMTFFRNVVTDQREDTPIHVVGFTPSPAGEVLQTVPLYAQRLTWYDHHEWAPEDLDALRGMLPKDALELAPGAGSVLPVVLRKASRRSRFSDKLVDLAAGRFTQHDYERWGRLWWHRLGEIAERPGDRRNEIDPLLVGRPSDLAREAAGVAVPELPGEVTWVSRRDFRIVHFAGYSMVVLEVEEPNDVNLTSRIARERYSAPFSLARQSGSDLFVLSADETSGRRSFDLGGMCDHLASKLGYVQVQADEDHVARFRIEGVDEHPERLDEIVSEIAMGRSTLEV